MIRKTSLWFAIFLIVVFGIGFSSATFSFKNVSMNSLYFPGESIEGQLNITFTNQYANSTLKDGWGNKISLLNMLLNNSFSENNEFNCTVSGCGERYSSDSELQGFEFDGDKIIGLRFVGGDISDVKSVSFDVEGDSGPSCDKQMTLDLLDSGLYEITNDKYTSLECGNEIYGCFDDDAKEYEENIISKDPFCENITLPEGPAFKVGAKIRNSTHGSEKLYMQLYDDSANLLSNCTLPSVTQSFGKVECLMPFANSKEKSYFLCISGEKDYDTNGPNYKIRSENSKDVCGSDQFLDGVYDNADYEIYAKQLQFDSFSLRVNDSVVNKIYDQTLSSMINDYISQKYSGQCDDECIVPIRLYGISQSAAITGVSYAYKSGKTNKEGNTVYDLNVQGSKLSSQNLILDLSKGGFIVPSSSSVKKFSLYLDSKLIFERAINTTQTFDFDITPKYSPLGQNTRYSILMAGSSNISSSWDFENGSVIDSTNKNATFRYLSAGEFKVTVTAVKPSGEKSTKLFTILVGNAKESVNVTLGRYDSRIANLTNKINTYPQWTKDLINSRLNLSQISANLSQLRAEFNSALTDERYSEIFQKISSLDVPYDIVSTEYGSAPFLIGQSNINDNLIKEVSADSSDFDYRDSIFNYISNNYKGSIDFQSVELLRDSGKENLLTKFKINLQRNGEIRYTDYLFIGYPFEQVKFMKDYSQKQVSQGAGTYLTLPSSSLEAIEFAVFSSDNVKADELGIYISPDTRYLEKTQNVNDILPIGNDDGQIVIRWGMFSIWLIVLIVVFLVVYIILQEWYKKNYEKSLFKSQNELYNIINFIYNARKQGLKDSDIKAKLSKSEWSGEQITYALKRIDGRRTGMWEIPIFKFSEKNKVRKEIENRQGAPVDARFINRPSF